MAFDPAYFLRVLAVRHAITREETDRDGTAQLQRPLRAELDELTAPARTLEDVKSFATSLRQNAAGGLKPASATSDTRPHKARTASNGPRKHRKRRSR
jgi:hypothetical protein